MSARSAPKILPIKGECTFDLLNFLRISLGNSFANYLLEMFPFLTVPLEDFLSKNSYPNRSRSTLISIIFCTFNNIKYFIS